MSKRPVFSSQKQRVTSYDQVRLNVKMPINPNWIRKSNEWRNFLKTRPVNPSAMLCRVVTNQTVA